MKILILILLSMGAFAQKMPAKDKSRAHFRRISAMSDKIHIKASAPKRNDNYLKRVLRSNQMLRSLLGNKQEDIVVWEDEKQILTGFILRGTLLNSINSTNLNSPVLVKSYDDPFVGATFSCRGITKHKRVLTLCDKMIFNNKEQVVSVQILNTDGTAGLLGEYDDGKDDLIVGAIVTEIATSVISSAMDMSETNFTKYPKSNLKNHLINGVVNGGQKASEVMLNDAKTAEPIVSVDSGKSVIIYFMEALHEK